MKSKSFRIFIGSISIVVALFLVGFLIYDLITKNALSPSGDGGSQEPEIQKPLTGQNQEEKLFEVTLGDGFYDVEGNVVILTKPDLPLTTISLVFITYKSDKVKDFHFEVVFEPNLDFMIDGFIVRFQYTKECEMKVKIVIEEMNYTQIESFLIKTQQTLGEV